MRPLNLTDMPNKAFHKGVQTAGQPHLNDYTGEELLAKGIAEASADPLLPYAKFRRMLLEQVECEMAQGRKLTLIADMQIAEGQCITYGYQRPNVPIAELIRGLRWRARVLVQ